MFPLRLSRKRGLRAKDLLVGAYVVAFAAVFVAVVLDGGLGNLFRSGDAVSQFYVAFLAFAVVGLFLVGAKSFFWAIGGSERVSLDGNRVISNRLIFGIPLRTRSVDLKDVTSIQMRAAESTRPDAIGGSHSAPQSPAIKILSSDGTATLIGEDLGYTTHDFTDVLRVLRESKEKLSA